VWRLPLRGPPGPPRPPLPPGSAPGGSARRGGSGTHRPAPAEARHRLTQGAGCSRRPCARRGAPGERRNSRCSGTYCRAAEPPLARIRRGPRERPSPPAARVSARSPGTGGRPGHRGR
jgi:hypothetical protein